MGAAGGRFPAGLVGKLLALTATVTQCFEANANALLQSPQHTSLWEIPCSPESRLSAEADKSNMSHRRFCYQHGYDVYREATWTKMLSEARLERPQRIWFSLPCTAWSTLQRINYYGRDKALADRRRKEIKLLRLVNNFIDELLSFHPDVHIYFEWPRHADGWKTYQVSQTLPMLLKKHGKELRYCNIDGCRYGMQAADGSGLIRKQWKIATTDHAFAVEFRDKTCKCAPGADHVRIQGANTMMTAYYPVGLCRSIMRHWNQSMARLYRYANLTEPLDSELCMVEDGVEPSSDEMKAWLQKVQHYHRAGGHSNIKALARMVKEAGKPRWQVKAVETWTCDICDARRPGGLSSGQVPPAATTALPMAWTHVGLDTAELPCIKHQCKIKFLVMIDLATKLKKVVILFRYGFNEARHESAKQAVEAVASGWLADKPKPLWVIPDGAKSFRAHEFTTFFEELNIAVGHPAEKEPWAHGVVERAVDLIKETALRIQDSSEVSPEMSLILAAAAHNATEEVQGYSPFAWAYGKGNQLSQEDWVHTQCQGTGFTSEFVNLLKQREQAEEIARKVRALKNLTALGNSKARQPHREFGHLQLVKLWRKMWPHELQAGSQGGFKKSFKPHWIGPGRVVLQEVKAGETSSDRKHVVWVLIGTNLYRASVHSVRPLTEAEAKESDFTARITPASIDEVLQRRHYTDLTSQVPTPDEVESPFLPPSGPDDSTVYKPTRRLRAKQAAELHPYARGSAAAGGPTEEEPPGTTASSDAVVPTTTTTSSSVLAPRVVPQPETIEAEEKRRIAELSQPSGARITDNNNDDDDLDFEVGTTLPTGPESKRARIGSDTAETQHAEHFKQSDQGFPGEAYLNLLQDAEPAEYVAFSVDLDFDSHRQKKKFLRNPELFLVGKLKNAEVKYHKLPVGDRRLFDVAKGKEVNQFIQNQAVRRCLDDQETEGAWESERILRARWVLNWK